MADLKRNGYGQVEPNHLSAQKTGQIYAQRPAASTITQLENGQFAKYSVENGAEVITLDASGMGEWLMVFNEVHMYDERDRFYKDFAMVKTDAVDGVIVPRLIKTNVGDIFTTNTIAVAGSKRADVTMTASVGTGETNAANVAVGAKYIVGTNGFLTYKASPVAADGPVFQVIKKTTMPDGQDALKFQRIQ